MRKSMRFCHMAPSLIAIQFFIFLFFGSSYTSSITYYSSSLLSLKSQLTKITFKLSSIPLIV